MLRMDAIVQSTLDLRLEEPANPETTGWRHPSILHCRGEVGEEGEALGHELTDSQTWKVPEKALETKARVDVCALHKQSLKAGSIEGRTRQSHSRESASSR